MEPGSHDALRGGERPDWGFSRDHGTPVKVLACLVDAIAGKVSPAGNRVEQEVLIRGCALFPDDQGKAYYRTRMAWLCSISTIVAWLCISTIVAWLYTPTSGNLHRWWLRAPMVDETGV